MMNRVGHIIRLVWLAVALHLMVGVAYGASLEKIEVNSRLGEPFFAEIPLSLDANELVSKLFVEIAAASDYKIFEVYRDPELTAIRADLESDARGVRVKLTSRTAIKAPFFNLIVKIRHGRVANFKKYPVFLEAAKNVVQAAEKAPVPAVVQTVPADNAVTEQAAVVAAPEVEAVPAVAEVQYFEGWARSDRYGPIIRGDVLSTVAQRLRVDKRYSNYQVMAALFEKNKSKFDQANMNLLMKDSFLNVPTAAEVETLSAKDAYSLFSKHEQQWSDLNQQPRFAVEAEVQRTRYSKRVRMGEQADGVASAPAAPVEVIEEEKVADGGDAVVTQNGVAAGEVDELHEAATEDSSTNAIAETTALLAELQKQNELLQQKLEQSEQSIATLSQKVDLAASAASDANVKRLEILMARMQGELEKAKAQSIVQRDAGVMDWVIWLLIALVVVLLIVVVLLMRREPAHPSAALVEPEIEHKAAHVAQQESVPEADLEDKLDTAEQPADDMRQDEPVAEAAAQKAVDAVEKESDLFDSIANFPDELTDTDTAEMVPFDFSAMEVADPNIDYLSEADVYTRYGMEEEALQQLDLALRLNAENTGAHIRKAELLFAKGDAVLFNKANAAALAVLSGAGLAEYKTAASAWSGLADETVTVDQRVPHEADEIEIAKVEEAESDEGPALDYDFSGLDGSDDDIGNATAAASDEIREFQTSDVSDFTEMDWLHDASFEDDVETSLADEEDIAGQTIALTSADGETQMIDSLLDSFEEDTGFSLADDEIDSEQSVGLLPDDQGTLDLEAIGATQELDNLLNAFTEESDGEAAAGDDVVGLDIEKEVTATQHLDSLLGEFSDDDGMFDGEEETIPATPWESPEDEDLFGATQHLDVLMSEFSNSDEQLSGLDFDALIPAVKEKAGDAGAEDPQATQQLDHLLSAFATIDDEAEVTEDHGATQQLDHLLGSFANQDDEPVTSASHRLATPAAAAHKSFLADEDPGATQQLDHLLGEFAAFGDGVSSDDDYEGLSFDKVDHLSEETDEIEVDHCATQELDHLLSEFADDDDNNKGSKA